jgi:hypothetical protein
MIVVSMVGCAPKPPESTGPLVEKLVGKKIIFTDTPPDTPINTNQPPRRIALPSNKTDTFKWIEFLR